MTVGDEFKRLLKAGNLPEAFALAFGEAIEIEITTWVNGSDWQCLWPEANRDMSDSHRLRTRINIIDGEIENEIDPEILADPAYRPLQQFHLEQTARGGQAILHNIESLQQLFRALSRTQSLLQQGPREEEPPYLDSGDEDEEI